ncbi:tetratricopeptide repeat protein [Panacagrimonas sp.]|uniref:tetratricopeptide repeat protein n=1 Tax=Panacagrimonas sp. TaxID=2480088 RepID=UPI003B52CC97
MNRCAESSAWRHVASLLLAASLLSGCASRQAQPDRPGEAVAPGTETAEPVADLGDPEARFAQALELMRTRQTTEAEAAFTALAEDFPEFSGPQTNLGILYAQSNRRDAAVAAFTRAATANPDNASAFNWLGVLNRQAGDFERARQAYEKALSVNPDYAAAHLNLGLLYEDHLGQPEQALVHYREYLRVTNGEDLRVLPWIGEIEASLAAKPAAMPAEEEVK